MKKTFRTILAGALALLTVSCYDDSALREDLKELDERVTAIESTLNAEVGGISDLATRLAAAETTLASLGTTVNGLGTSLTALDTQVAGLVTRLDAADGKIDGVIKDLEKAVAELKEADKTLTAKDLELAAEVAKIAVVKVEKKTGSAVLTLADGTTVELSMPLANVDNSGLVTVVEVEGVKYWATVGADGTATSLDVPVGHPDYVIAFEVAEDGKLMYTVNGGAAQETGVSTADISGQKYMITEVEENETNVVVTIGEAQYTFPKYLANNSELKLAVDNMYLKYSAEKVIMLEMKDIAELYVVNQPNGWKAKVENDSLVVVAPAKAAVEIGAADVDGAILLHAETLSGDCLFATVEVSTGKGLIMSLDGTQFSFMNSNVSAAYDPIWGDFLGYSFTDFYVGIVKAEDFDGNEKEFFEYVKENYEAPSGYVGYMYNYPHLDFTPYEEAVYEIDKFSLSVADMYKYLAWDDEDGIDAGVEYVIWCAPYDDKGIIMSDEIETVRYMQIVTDSEISNITHNDATISINVKGATKFFVGCIQDPAVLYGPAVTLDMVMAESSPWRELIYGMPEYIELGVYTDGEYSDILMSTLNYGDKLAPGSKYYYWVFPYKEGVVYDDYATQFAPYIKEFTTLPLQAGGPATVLSIEALGYNNVKANVEVAEGVESVKYAFYTESDWSAFDSDEDAIRADLLESFYSLSETDVVSKTGMTPGQTVVCAAISISEDGKYGAVSSLPLTTKTIARDEAMAVTFDSLTISEDGKTYTAVVNVSGAVKVCGYNVTYSASNASGAEVNIASNPGTYSSYQWAEVGEGKATLSFAVNAYKKDYIVWAYSVDQDGNFDKISNPLTINIETSLAE